MTHKLLIINPGSTSTKLALFEDQKKLVQENIEHDASMISKFNTVVEQVPFRTEVIKEFISRYGYSIEDLSAVVGRGGIVFGLHAGGYLVNDDLVTALSSDKYSSPHASNMGGLLAKAFADQAGLPSYIYDAVTGGDLEDVATITGFPEVIRSSTSHLLNSHAMAVKYAQSIGREYKDLNLIIAHLGGGISVSAHSHGKLIDSVGDDEGHFSPERSGTIPQFSLIDLCYSGKYTKDEMKKKVRGKGGMYAHLGTSDCRKIEDMIANGDKHAELIYDAQALQISKSIGLLSVTEKGKTDAIILTGGVAHSELLTEKIKEYVSFIAPVVVLPGENEMEALAFGGLRILNGEEEARTYILPEV